MNIKIFLIVVILVVLTMGGIFAFNRYKYSERSNIKIPILLYHDFMSTIPDKDPDNFNYINTPESFEENMKFIIKSGYTIISMRELNDANIGKVKLPSKPILITYDDGYYSNYEYIYPIIKKYNIKASIFVVTDRV